MYARIWTGHTAKLYWAKTAMNASRVNGSMMGLSEQASLTDRTPGLSRGIESDQQPRWRALRQLSIAVQTRRFIVS
jgi:hypothetical protein